MNILVINAGSSSLKYQLINMKRESLVAKGLVERIGIEGSVLKHRPVGKQRVEIKKEMQDHTQAIQMVLQALTDKEHGVLEDIHQIHAVGHRIVHGGEHFKESVLIDDEVIQAIRDNAQLAPLHNPANIMGIEACQKVLEGVPMVAVFDTAFHQSMPPKAFLYALPYSYYTDKKIRRYGFHGTSHSYVAARASTLMGKPMEELKIITCHLGNGSSVAAVKNGKCVDTSMGFTPLEGVPMGTRSGIIDPAIIFFLLSNYNMSVQDVNRVLNKESGMEGLSGVSSDFRDLWEAVEEGNQRAKQALEVFCYGVKKYVGAYAAAMGGVDCIVFTAGVGENDHGVREWVIDGLDYMGAKIDLEKNMVRGQECDISAPDAKVK
ncbi:MAG: acetate/propionate family kinase, partial [Christensenellales bacterium]